MDFRLENLSEDDFERLVNVLCQKILGFGTVSFTKGKDGGRDGRFEGVANEYPSKSEPWKGKFIIQAKHTTDYNASCSDPTFFKNQTSLINKEIESVKELLQYDNIDNYLIFTNRKETATREIAIKEIKLKTNINNVDIIGKDTIHSWLTQNQEIAKTFKLGNFALSLILTDFDIKEVITEFGKFCKTIQTIEIITDEKIIAISKETKNKLNNLNQEYYTSQITKSLHYFAKIDDFLMNDENLSEIYYNFASELSNKIAIKRSTFESFESIFLYLYDYIFESNQDELSKYKRYIWIFLHHLYFNCHIGRTQ